MSWNTPVKYDPFSNVTNSPKKYFPLDVKMAINFYILCNKIMCVCVHVYFPPTRFFTMKMYKNIMYVLPLTVKIKI